MYNIIGDVAGQYKTLLALLDKMPEATPISVGDMVDRGPQSREVVDFFMKNGKAVLGNHEDMMLDWYDTSKRVYQPFIWEANGGDSTIESYVKNIYGTGDFTLTYEEIVKCFDVSHIEWLSRLPLYLNLGELLVTHAPIPKYSKLLDNSQDKLTAIWNRNPPKKIEGKFQIYGHNAKREVLKHEDWGICIDTSIGNKLTGIHWPSLELFEQEYIK